MRNVLVTMAMLLLVSTAFSAPANDGSDAVFTSFGNILSESGTRNCDILYAPADDDAAAFRADLAALTGGVVDYYDARVSTPDLALLSGYDAVICFPNYAFFDNIAMGDVLADYSDEGGTVVLCVWCTYIFGNYLGGRIMEPAYCPVYSDGNNHYLDAAYAGDGTSCIYIGVNSFTHFYRDYLFAQGAGILDGSYTDGEVAAAYQGKVFYANGYPMEANADWTAMVFNMACVCDGPTATDDSSWSTVKALY